MSDKVAAIAQKLAGLDENKLNKLLELLDSPPPEEVELGPGYHKIKTGPRPNLFFDQIKEIERTIPPLEKKINKKKLATRNSVRSSPRKSSAIKVKCIQCGEYFNSSKDISVTRCNKCLIGR